jgi:hypothetical protein
MCRDGDYRLAQAQVVVFEMATQKELNWAQHDKLSAALKTIAELQPRGTSSRGPKS